MAYDGAGYWDPNAPGQHSSLAFARNNVNYWLRRGLLKSQAVLGVPFYGYGFGTAFRKRDYPYSEIITNFPGAELLDQVGDTIWYNGLPTIRAKAQYVLDQDLGGVMIWSLDYDGKDERSLLTAIASTFHPVADASPAEKKTLILLPPPSQSKVPMVPCRRTVTSWRFRDMRSLPLVLAIWFVVTASVCPASAQTAIAPTDPSPLILVHYMPWFGANPAAKQWGWHWTMNHFHPDQITNGQPDLASHYHSACRSVRLRRSGSSGVPGFADEVRGHRRPPHRLVRHRRLSRLRHQSPQHRAHDHRSQEGGTEICDRIRGLDRTRHDRGQTLSCVGSCCTRKVAAPVDAGPLVPRRFLP